MKKLLIVVLAIIMSLGIIVINAENDISGKNGSVSWKINDTELIFYPTNKVEGSFEGNFKSADWKNYADTVKTVKFEGIINMPEISNYFLSDMINLKNVDFTNANFDKVTDMKSFFDGCSNLIDIDLTTINLSKVRGLEYLCRNCTSLTEVDFSNVNGFGNSPRLYQAFSGCTNLTRFNFGSLKISGSNTNTLSGIFKDCKKLNTVIIPKSVDFSLASSSIGGPTSDEIYWENENSNRDFRSLTELSKYWSDELVGTWKVGSKRGTVIIEYIDLSTDKALSDKVIMSNLKYKSEYLVEPIEKDGYEVVNLYVYGKDFPLDGKRQDPDKVFGTVEYEELRYVYEYYKIGSYKYNNSKLTDIKNNTSFKVYTLSANKAINNSYYNSLIDVSNNRLDKDFSSDANQWKNFGSTKEEAILAILYWNKEYTNPQEYISWLVKATSFDSSYPVKKTYKDIPDIVKKGLNLEIYGSTIKDGIDVCTYRLTKLYEVSYEFRSTDDEIELPDEILDLLPEDSKYYRENEYVRVITAEFEDIEVEHGVWQFDRYNKTSFNISADKDNKFIGYWEFIEDEKYEEIYTYTPWNLPDEVERTLPETNKEHYNGEKVKPMNPSKTRIVLDNGEWNFIGWDEDYIIVEDEDIEFIGTWEFTSYMRKITFMDDTGKLIETKEIKLGETVIPPTPIKLGYVFKEWDKSLDNITEDMMVKAIFEKKPFNTISINIPIKSNITNDLSNTELKVIIEPLNNSPEQSGLTLINRNQSYLGLNFNEPGEFSYKVYLEKDKDGYMIDKTEYIINVSVEEILNKDGNNDLKGIRDVVKNNESTLEIEFNSVKTQNQNNTNTEVKVIENEEQTNSGSNIWIWIICLGVALLACLIIMLVVIKKMN